MYQRIKSYLLVPKNLFHYVNGKFISFFLTILVFGLLLTLPFIKVLHDIPSTLYTSLCNNIVVDKAVYFKVENQKLEKLYFDAESVCFKIDNATSNIYLVIGEYDLTNIKSQDYSFVFHCEEEKINLKMISNLANLEMNLYSFNYPNEKLDLTKLNNAGSLVRYQLFSNLKEVLDSLLPTFMSLGVLIVLLSSILSLLFTCLIFSVVGYIMNNKFGIRFKECYKFAILSLAPYVLGNIFQTIIGNTASIIIYYVGFITSVIYFTIAIRHYILFIKFIEKNEESKNESI